MIYQNIYICSLFCKFAPIDMKFSEYCNIRVCHIRSMFALTNTPKITSIFSVCYFTFFIFVFYVSFSPISISYIYI